MIYAIGRLNHIDGSSKSSFWNKLQRIYENN